MCKGHQTARILVATSPLRFNSLSSPMVNGDAAIGFEAFLAGTILVLPSPVLVICRLQSWNSAENCVT